MDGKLTPPNPVNLVIDGARLRQLREEAGLSVSALARMAALSKNQIEQLENGGDSLFYNQGVKRQAARKLASLFGVDPKTVLADANHQAGTAEQAPTPIAAHEEAAAVTPAHVLSDDVPLATEAQTSPTSPLDTPQEATSRPAQTAAHVTLVPEPNPIASGAAVSAKKSKPRVWLWLLLALFTALGTAGGWAWQQGLLPHTFLEDWEELAEHWMGGNTDANPQPPAPAVAAVAPSVGATTPQNAPETSSTVAMPAMTPTEIEDRVAGRTSGTEQPQTAIGSPAQSVCPERRTDLSPSYSPQASKPGNRVHIISNLATTVCLHDATGQQWVREIKPHVPQTFIGKAPWWIGSHEMSQIQIFYQGWRVFDAKADAKQIYLRERAVAAAPAVN